MAFFPQESASLQKVASHLKKENQRLLRELNLNAEAEQQLSQRAAILVHPPPASPLQLKMGFLFLY